MIPLRRRIDRRALALAALLGCATGAWLARCPPERGAITGQVTDNGYPVTGAQVCALGSGPAIAGVDSDRAICATTDAGGGYRLGSLVPGRYWLSAWARPFSPEPREPLTVRAGQVVAGIDFALKTGGTVVAGEVRDGADRPVAGAEVRIESAEWAGPDVGWTVSWTDRDGTFRAWAPAGEIRALASAEGHVTTEVHAAEGARLAIDMVPGSVIEGQVIDRATGRPVAGARVAPTMDTPRPYLRDAEPSALSDRDGRFRLARLGPGRYALEATADGRRGAAPRSIAVGVGQTAAIDIVMHPASPVTAIATAPAATARRIRGSVEMAGGAPADLVLLPTGRVEGRVVDLDGRPMAGARVAVYGSPPRWNGSARANDGGWFAIDDVPVGRYAVSVSDATWDVRLRSREGVVEVMRDEVAKLELPVDHAVYQLVGRVVDASGRPVPGAYVSAQPCLRDEPRDFWLMPELRRPTVSDRGGWFQLAVSRRHHHDVGAYRVGGGQGTLDWVAEGTLAVVTIHQPRSIRGTVRASGDPPRELTIEVEPLDTGPPWCERAAVTRGEWLITGLPAGRYKITVSAATPTSRLVRACSWLSGRRVVIPRD